MNRAMSHLSVMTISASMLVLAACRSPGPSASFDRAQANVSSLEAMVSGGSASSKPSDEVAVLRFANRLPRIEFPSVRPSCLDQGESFGAWTVRFDGYGCVAVDGTGRQGALEMGPKKAQKDHQTHAPMVLGPHLTDRMVMHARVETTAQLRNGTPNPWEVAWVIWQYTDDQRFYYFIPKPNGWELGKRDPAYPGGQRFLGSGEKQTFPINRTYDVTIVQVDDAIAVFVDGREIVRVRDQETPYRKGRIGIYAEDASVKVHAVRAL